jgi:abhydrolase domain-containing protein 6
MRTELLISFLHRLIRLRYRILGLSSHFLQIEGCTVHYLVSPPYPDRQTLLLIHGLGTSSSSWVRILPSLISTSNIVAIDLPGFGFSTLSPNTPYLTLKKFDRVLAAFVEQALPPRITLLGHSLGGWIAMRFSLRFPSMVDKLILVNPAGVYYPGVEVQAELFSLRSVHDVARLLETMWFRYPFVFKLFNRAIYHDLIRRNVTQLVQEIGEGEFVNQSLPQLRMPVHIIWGKEDRLISEESLHILAEKLPSATITYLDSCGHIPQLEKPRELTTVLKKILPRL